VVALDRQGSPIAGLSNVPTESVYAVLGAKQAAKPAYGRVSFDVENGRR